MYSTQCSCCVSGEVDPVLQPPAPAPAGSSLKTEESVSQTWSGTCVRFIFIFN